MAKKQKFDHPRLIKDDMGRHFDLSINEGDKYYSVGIFTFHITKLNAYIELYKEKLSWLS